MFDHIVNKEEKTDGTWKKLFLKVLICYNMKKITLNYERISKT